MEGQYSPVRLELAKLVSSLLYGTWAMLFWICRFSKTKNTQPMTISMEMVCMAESWPRENQSECLDLPCLTIIQNILLSFQCPNLDQVYAASQVSLYGRILTSVVCTDLTAFGLYLRPRLILILPYRPPTWLIRAKSWLRSYRPHCIWSVLTTSVKILPYRPARLLRAKWRPHS